MHSYLIPFGGILTASGMMTMLIAGWSGPNGVHMSEQIANLGFSAVADIGLTSSGILAFVLIFTGIAMMVYGNATAYKVTGGY
ncbi:MAG: hypothetical protein VX899_14240 [Myxococcota bacterium]|nr:hypothetical protein [Myxococcota bacterium]